MHTHQVISIYPSSEKDWKKQLSEAISSPAELLQLLELEHLLTDQIETSSNFRQRVPRAYVNKMKKGDPKDPLLLQVLPTLQKMN